jgi:hypothetical protein
MLRTTADRKLSSALRLPVPAAAVTTLTITAELARWHAGLVFGTAIVSAVVVLTADVVITAIHGGPMQSLRALYLIGMILRRHVPADPGDNNVHLALDPFGCVDVTASQILSAAITMEDLITFLTERAAAANKATGQAQDMERSTTVNGSPPITEGLRCRRSRRSRCGRRRGRNR